MRRSESGGATLEIVIVAPFVLLLFMLILAFARFAQAENVIDQAARDAARAATAQNQKGKVNGAVDDAARDALNEAPSSCQQTAAASTRLSDEAFEFDEQEETSVELESVSVEVSCVVDMSDLVGLPLGHVTVTRTFTSPLDRYRGYVE